MSIQKTAVVQDAYEYLLQAEHTKKSVTPLTDLYPGLTVLEAYQVQLKAIDQKVAGQKIVGKKIGLTSFDMQELLGVDQPDYTVTYLGHSLDVFKFY